MNILHSNKTILKIFGKNAILKKQHRCKIRQKKISKNMNILNKTYKTYKIKHKKFLKTKTKHIKKLYKTGDK